MKEQHLGVDLISGLRRTSTSSPPWIFIFLASVVTIRTGTRDSKIKDDEDIDVLRRPA